MAFAKSQPPHSIHKHGSDYKHSGNISKLLIPTDSLTAVGQLVGLGHGQRIGNGHWVPIPKGMPDRLPPRLLGLEISCELGE